MRVRSASAGRQFAARLATAALALSTAAALTGLQPAPPPVLHAPATAAIAAARPGCAVGESGHDQPAARRTPHVGPPQIERAAHKSASDSSAAVAANVTSVGGALVASAPSACDTSWTLRYGARASRTRGRPFSAS